VLEAVVVGTGGVPAQDSDMTPDQLIRPESLADSEQNYFYLLISTMQIKYDVLL